MSLVLLSGSVVVVVHVVAHFDSAVYYLVICICTTCRQTDFRYYFYFSFLCFPQTGTKMESRLSSANYCTVVKGRRTGDILALDVDVVGDPLRPKEAVITASGLSGRPRAIACKTCRVTAGFGVL